MFGHFINDDIQLRILEDRHSEELFRLTDVNRAYLREWMPWVDSTIGVEQSRGFIQSSLKQFAENQGFNLGVTYQGQLAGCIGVHQVDWGNRKASIGYWLGEEYQRKGIMTLSCRMVINHIFKEWELNRAEIRAAVLNKKSRAIAERLGFVNEGTIRQAEWLYDHYVDHVVYGMLREDWDK